MFLRPSRNQEDQTARLRALDRVQGVIEFDLSGNVTAANANFLNVVGYTLTDVLGRHHGMFVDPVYRDSAEYRAFWDRLRAGEFQAAQFRRIAKNGDEVWIEASYNPLIGRDGKAYKIVKFATDITRQKIQDADRAGQIAAIGRSQAVIEFDLDGVILDANDNFLATVGYSLSEIQGQRHAMFVEQSERTSHAYVEFWAALKRGDYRAGRYRRRGKDGRAIWIEGSYNPIFDAAGRPYKVIKFATDITQQMALLTDLRRMIDENFVDIDRALTRSNHESDVARRLVEQTSQGVRIMAAASEELATSVAEISDNMTKSRSATDSAFQQARVAGDFTKRLSDAAAAMGGIVGLIQSIAGQINLLALNATIESARAGEAGRGFAVVAQEVKNLANQAARATDQISGEINGVQAMSNEVVRALSAIQDSMELMRENVVATAGSVEQQTTVTREMSSNMQDAAQSVSAISGNIAAISTAVSEVSVAVAVTRDAAQVLSR